MSLEQARTQLAQPIPDLPNIVMRECGGRSKRISLIRVYVKGPEVLLAYTHGLWMSVGGKRLGLYFLERRVRDGSVRGHPAQITARGRKRKVFFCGDGFSCGEKVVNEVEGTGAAFYPNGAELHWVENDLDIHLQGPYKDSVLIELAEGLRFG